ncbi:energy-coupling factor transporter transmembrane protein EcfT [Clostridium polyendosporum]|uniref:Energy-coupling factor transporter transmembrane protein EcfT n=1 Tax=Clostridium polyendosporum TaxID=69208 RepID=A0A919S282_9CLOT|nr:energy-coupling factor transporter transmembrane component T [Clostridium polyendosporum]GIM29243.1 energy-coupling factor transporter transmembrane protein EcfT [Clostridium polyendosporum]
MDMLKPGQYIKENSIVHNLDPRTKLIYCMFIASSTLINSNGLIILLNICTLILAMLLSWINIYKFFLRLKSLILLFVMTFIFQSILTDGEILFHIGTINFTKQGVYLGIITAFRFMAIYLCSTILTMTTSPMKLASGLESLFSPLVKLHIPVNQLSMMISISLRFIPTIIEETENIKCAQKSRGAQFESGSFFVKLKSMLAVVIPVLAASLQRANDLAIAMESRCYHGKSSSKIDTGLHYKRIDIIVIGVVLLNLIVCLIT